jgi:hypothetical protein
VLCKSWLSKLVHGIVLSLFGKDGVLISGKDCQRDDTSAFTKDIDWTDTHWLRSVRWFLKLEILSGLVSSGSFLFFWYFRRLWHTKIRTPLKGVFRFRYLREADKERERSETENGRREIFVHIMEGSEFGGGVCTRTSWLIREWTILMPWTNLQQTHWWRTFNLFKTHIHTSLCLWTFPLAASPNSLSQQPRWQHPQ